MKPDSILVVSPFHHPDPEIVRAAIRAGHVGVLDLGTDPDEGLAALGRLAGQPAELLGLRIPDGVCLRPDQMPPCVGIVVLPTGSDIEPWRHLRVLVQATSLEEALEAESRGADGIIAKGSESGGRVGNETAFVLLQRLRGHLSRPVWLQGGIGLHTAVAAFVGGAEGVVLDAQLALARESRLPGAIKDAVAAMDGSETTEINGFRVYDRPDIPLAELAAEGVAAKLGASDLKTRLLPAGMEACFAGSLAKRYETVGGILRAVKSNIKRQIQASRSGGLFAPETRFARSLNLDYPIVQGPMTRVSDTSEFAGLVAEGGGLPFLALALMRGPEVRRLLQDTKARLGERSWGVGILGFVPPELQEEQLEIIHEVRPPAALIAGGRPAQARRLEDAGIKTFIHVPSPGLLDLFLQQGATRFVFEGMECGGHVGPRSSLVLWESQIERLLQHDRPQELSVLFAGGIHDRHSAAMVSALAARLIERGIDAGVLLGTAYVFTEEAVRAGAIKEGFQQAALNCDRTVLLGTAPGHSTRCAPTPYVAAFEEAKARLKSESKPQEEIWAALEELNLGRLRIASKGLQREGSAVVEVDEATQRAEGMVMLGQAAALRGATTTVKELHEEVAAGAREVLGSVAAPASPARPLPGRVAIVGMAAVMPGAADVEEFWSNIVEGVNSIREVPPERWNADIFFDPASRDGTKTPSKWGGFIDPVLFDPLRYGIPPRALAAIEPVQLLALEVSRRALEDAGYDQRDFDREHTSVLFGAEAGNDLAGAYSFRALWQQYAGALPQELAEVLPEMTEDSFPGILGNVISGRIANRLDLGGANFTVDAACASSLAAVDLACKDLLSRSSEMVICGGADLHNSITDYLAFASVHALSPTGQSRTFDAAADGISLGEGVAALVLKRLEDAERDGDRIYAVIDGIGTSSDGRSLGLTAPRPEGEERALERAYEAAAISPAEVGLLEAHGTGTVVGDRTELETLNDVFRRAGARPGTAVLGSVKSQIGHTKCAAGVAGVIKSALALHHRVLPPTLNVESPNVAWTRESPFVIEAAARPWLGDQRKAGVSAFGFGGTNFHVVLSEYAGQTAESGTSRWPAELFLIRGSTPAEALSAAESLQSFAASGIWKLRDLAASVSRQAGTVEFAIVAQSAEDLIAKLDSLLEGQHAAGLYRRSDEASALGAGKIGFLFPGQGSQRPGMLRELFITFPSLRKHLEAAGPLAGLILPTTPWTEEERQKQTDSLTETFSAQPALGVAGTAVAELLASFGVTPHAVAGHSYGELVALAYAGVLPREDLVKLSEMRARSILEATAEGGDPGAMAAVATSASTAAEVLPEDLGVVVANANSPEQTVISGSTPGIAAALEAFKAAGIAASRIPVACAFHSPLVAKAAGSFARALEPVELGPPSVVVYSNTTAAQYPEGEQAVRARLAEHIASPVLFAGEIEAMYEDGMRIFIETGPGRVLSGLVSKTLGQRPHLTLACDEPRGGSLATLLSTLAQLAVAGISVDAEALFRGRDATQIDFETPPDPLASASAWWVNGQRAWPVNGPSPEHAMIPVTKPVVDLAAAARGNLPSADRDAVVMEYLRTVRESFAATEKVMLGYLGQQPATIDQDYDAAAVISANGGGVPISEPPGFAEAVPNPSPAGLPTVSAGVPESSGWSVEELESALITIVSERTGYPRDMLGLDLDLEADLSIDSIKRIEILGGLTQHLGLRSADELQELPDDIVRLKTMRSIVAALANMSAETGAGRALPSGSEQTPRLLNEPVAPPPELIAAAPQAVAAAAAGSENGAHAPPPTVVGRFIRSLVPTGRLEDAPELLAGMSFAVEPAPNEIGSCIAEKLKDAGCEDAAAGDIYVDLRAMGPEWGTSSVVDVFEAVRDRLVAGARNVVLATRLAPSATNGVDRPLAGAGLAGMVKSLAREWPDRTLQVIHFETTDSPAFVADQIVRELSSSEGYIEVIYSAGVRRVPRPARADLGSSAAPNLELPDDAVILATGGGRGITALSLIELARHQRCRFELVGRTELHARDRYADLAGASGLPELRNRLAQAGETDIAAIDRKCRAILANREIWATIDALEGMGSSAAYHEMDVRDSSELTGFIESLYDKHGRIDGAIHGAGVLDDHLAVDKTRESFLSVFETKAASAATLVAGLRDDTRFVVFFGSVVGVFGNRGQSDYAAANDFLDWVALELNRARPGRYVSLDWGPWANNGMVSGPLVEEYERRGIRLIPPELGAESFVRELLYGPSDEAQVIFSAADPAVLALEAERV